jgi:Putative Actinobacterial Holin-X, holin superfamily III
MSERSSGGLFSGIKAELEANIDARISLLKLEATEKIARLTGVISVVIVAGVCFLFMLLSISLMAGFYFSRLLNSDFYGFAIVAGFFFLTFIITVVMGRKKLATFIADKMVEAIWEKTNDPNTEME